MVYFIVVQSRSVTHFIYPLRTVDVLYCRYILLVTRVSLLPLASQIDLDRLKEGAKMKMAPAFSISSERHWQSGVNGIAKEVPKCSALPGF